MRNALEKLSDAELLANLKNFASQERRRAVELLKHLAETDRRNAAVKAGYPSLFEYCVKELRFTHAETLRRIQAARAADGHRLLYRYISRGLLSITAVSLLAPHLDAGNRKELIRAAAGKSTREVEALISGLSSSPKIVERVRFIGPPPAAAPEPGANLFDSPAQAPAGRMEVPHASSLLSKPAASVEPPAANVGGPAPSRCAGGEVAGRVLITFTAPAAFWGEVERLRELTRSRWPGGRLEDLIPGAVDALIAKLDPERRAGRRGRALQPAAPAARRPPAAVRAFVWKRDGGRCAYRSEDGRVCGTRSGLEVDHIKPWALGGRSDEPSNLRLLCRAHNQSEARRLLGDARIEAAIEGRRSQSART